MFRIDLAEGALDDLRELRAFERARVVDEMERHLVREPDTPTRRRKLLWGLVAAWASGLPVWELRLGTIRTFYDVDGSAGVVTVRAVRRKLPHVTTEEIL